MNYYGYDLNTRDGMETVLGAIQEETEVAHSGARNTKLYSANLLKGDTSQLGNLDKICFELPKDLQVEDALQYLSELVSISYKNRETVSNQKQYTHIGVINYDYNNGIQYYKPSEHIKNWIQDNLDKRLLKQSKAYSKEEEAENLRQQARNEQAIYEDNQKNEIIERWSNPIFKTQKDLHSSSLNYTFYQQPIDNSVKDSGFTTLKNMQLYSPIKHADGSIGYVYSANVFNRVKEDKAEGIADIYPKVCFELPCRIEEIETQMQRGDYNTVRMLGQMCSDKNLYNSQVKTNGELTWIGRVKENYVDKNPYVFVERYINEQNQNIRRMNGNSGRQSNQQENYR